ncbi:MAG TPA: hypothetical protein VGH80_02550 [Xanthomonadaceae bacterium]|jgi:hypothetical protein
MKAATSPSIGARLRSVLLWVSLAVLWTAAWLAGTFLLATSHDASAQGAGQMFQDTIARSFGLRGLPPTLMAPWFANILAIVALVTLAVVAVATLLDRAGHAPRALRWSLRTLPCLAAWIAVLVACAWLTSFTPLAEYAGAFLLVAWIVFPFVFLRPDVIAADRPPLLWWPAWPGLPAIAATLLALAAFCGIHYLLMQLVDHALPPHPSWALQMPVGLVEWAAELALTVFALSTWQNRWNWVELGKGMPVANLGTGMRVLLAFELRWFWLTLLLFYPVVLGLPVVIDTASTYLQHAPGLQASSPPDGRSLLGLAVKFADFFTAYWWLATLVVGGALQYWWQFAAKARTLYLAEAKEDAGHA